MVTPVGRRDRSDEESAGTSRLPAPVGAVWTIVTRGLPEAVATVSRQGRTEFVKAARALRHPLGAPPASPDGLRQRVACLEAELKLEQAVNEFLEGEAMRLEAGLAEERRVADDYLARLTNLEWQLAEARKATLKLISASRNSLALVKKVRLDLVENTFLRESLDPLVHDLREVAQAAQELQVFAQVKPAGTALTAASP